jgi:hypothetical protein
VIPSFYRKLKRLKRKTAMIEIIVRKPPTPPSNRHGEREPPRPTARDIAAILEEEMDEGEEPNDKIPQV